MVFQQKGLWRNLGWDFSNELYALNGITFKTTSSNRLQGSQLMKIFVKSYIYQALSSETGVTCERDIRQNGCTVAQLLDELGMPGHEVGLIFVNNARVGKSHHLEEGDTIEVIPLLDGG